MATPMSFIASAADAAYALVRPLVHASDGEAAHNLTLSALQPLPRARRALTSPVLATELAGLHFPNPVGLAPGFDKDARAAHAMPHFGFGFVEVGTLTPLPQEGNPRPRLFRLVEDRAVINRMGFNNGGQAKAADRIACLRRYGLPVPLGINIGANKDSADRIADYAKGTAAMAPLADYLTVNISSPNTPGLRALQDKGALEALLDGVAADLIVAQGGTAILGETPEIYGAEHLLTRRAVRREVGEKLVERIKWWESYTQLFGAEVCIGGKGGAACRLSPAASEFAKKVNSSMNGGQCEGMAVSALTFFRNIDNVKAFSPTAKIRSSPSSCCGSGPKLAAALSSATAGPSV